jgi:hypothetical protein
MRDRRVGSSDHSREGSRDCTLGEVPPNSECAVGREAAGLLETQRSACNALDVDGGESIVGSSS